MECDICGKTFLLLKTCQDKKLHNDLTKPCEMCKEGIRCERMDNYKGHSLDLRARLTYTKIKDEKKKKFSFVTLGLIGAYV